MPIQVSNTNYFKAIDFHPFSQENLPYTIGVGVVTVTALAFLARHLYQTYSVKNRHIQVVTSPVASQPAEVESPKPRQLVARPMTELQKKIAKHPIGAVFDYLTPNDIVTASRVCKAWRRAASEDLFWEGFDLKELFPKLKIIDRKVWEKLWDLESYGLDLSDAKEPSKLAVILKLNQIFYALKKKGMRIKGDMGITRLTIPKNLHFEMFREMVAPREDLDGNGCMIEDRDIDIQKYDKFVASKTFTVLIANGLLEGEFPEDRILDGMIGLDTCKRLLKGTAGGEVPELLPFITNMALNYVISPEEAPARLFPRTPVEDEEKKYQDHNFAVVYDAFDPVRRRAGDFHGNVMWVQDDQHCTDTTPYDQPGQLTAMWRL